jgi:hypothetical protein
MVGKVRTIERHLLRPMCVACGYDGALLRAGQVERCPRCRCNLGLRPARSYAEMEGLLDRSVALVDDSALNSRPERLMHRWVVFLFFALLGLLAIVYLVSAALAV